MHPYHRLFGLSDTAGLERFPSQRDEFAAPHGPDDDNAAAASPFSICPVRSSQPDEGDSPTGHHVVLTEEGSDRCR